MQLKLSCLAKFAKLGKTCCIWYTHTYVQYIIYITYVYVLYVYTYVCYCAYVL